MSIAKDADKIAHLLEALDQTSVTIREGVSPTSPTGTGPLSKSTLDDLRNLDRPGSQEKLKVHVKLWVDFASE